MVKLYDNNFRAEDINTVERGDVIVYKSKLKSDKYLIVSKVDVAERKISGMIASPLSVSCLPLEEIVED